MAWSVSDWEGRAKHQARLNLDFGVRSASREGGGTEEDPRRGRRERIAITGTPEGIDRAKKDLSEMIKTRKANGGWSTGLRQDCLWSIIPRSV